MDIGEKIIREFEDLFGLITAYERKWLRDKIAAIPATRGWEDISTAPKDMQPFLAFVRASREPIQEESDSWHVVYCKRANTFVLQDDHHTIVEPTHWKPLDAPAVIADDRAEGK